MFQLSSFYCNGVLLPESETSTFSVRRVHFVVSVVVVVVPARNHLHYAGSA